MDTQHGTVRLKRSLTLPLVVLYGVGVTVGAGIYVLIGVAASKAGVYAPMSFILAAIIVAFSAMSFSELAGRFPLSAGEAAYVRAGFKSQTLSLIVGLMVVASATISSATISIGAAGYILEFFKLPEAIIVVGVIFLMAAIAAWGIAESVKFAGLFTIIEVGGLLAIVAAAVYADPTIASRLDAVIPPFQDFGPWFGILGATLLAFFAFVGFEDIVNLAEEVENPKRVLPWAIFLTLGISTLIYFMVVSVAVLTIPVEELASSRAPLGLVFERITGASAHSIRLIAIVATLNGVIVQIIMASRVLYGLGRQKAIPEIFGQVYRRTQTPLVATAVVTGLILVLALLIPLQDLAEITSRVVLAIFCIVNAALIAIKVRREPAPDGAVTVGLWVPVVGCIVCVVALAMDVFVG